MINILFFIESLSGGGAEKVLRNLVNAMDQQKFAITVQTLYPEEIAQSLRPGIRYRYCYPAATKWNNARMRLEAALGWTYPLHIRGDYDIEVAYLECGSTKIMAGSTNRRAVKLAWVHCDLAKKAADPAAFARETAKYYKKFDKIVCVSQDVRRSFAEMYGMPEKLVTLYNCYDDAEILTLAQNPLPAHVTKRRLTGLAIGRLSNEKGIDRLLRVQKRLRDAGVCYDLWILGDGPQRAMLERYIAENQLSDSVRLFGFQENPYAFIRAADFLICASRYEGFSTVVVEGLILGTPTVTTNCSGMGELLGDSEYGLITENNEDALYFGLHRMLTEPKLREHYQEMAKKRGTAFRQDILSQATERFLADEWKQKTECWHGR